ncbi:hypothetical protein Q3G72_006811 [Acer saccharum]|nr:hypothetical protein Q3G72_006811 [Acer saccharum]
MSNHTCSVSIVEEMNSGSSYISHVYNHKSEETRAGHETKRNSLPFSALPPPQPFSTITNRCFTFISWYNLCHEFE